MDRRRVVLKRQSEDVARKVMEKGWCHSDKAGMM